MGGGGGGAATEILTTTTKFCLECSENFTQNPNDPGQLFCAKAYFRKNQSQKIKSAAPEKQAKRRLPRPVTLPVPQQAANGQKKNQDSRTPSTPNTELNPSSKK